MTRYARLAAMLRALALGATSVAGCTARTLPLPPPDLDPLVAPNAQSLVKVSGLAQEGASIAVLNETTQQGLLVTSPQIGCDRSCRFDVQIAAHSGDTIRVWQFFETPADITVKVPK